MKRSTIGYSALLTAVICYAYAFYKMAIVTRTGAPLAPALGDLKYFCLLIAGPGVTIFYTVRRVPVLALIYLAFVLAWAVNTGLELKPNRPYSWDMLDDPLFGAWFGGVLVTWPPFLPVAFLRIGLAFECIGRRLEARFDPRRSKSGA